MTTRSGKQIVNVLIKIIIKKFKKEEFFESICMYQANIRKQHGFLSFDLYQDANEENNCRLVGKWQSTEAMEKHFKTEEFELLFGAAKVLCDSFEIETTNVLNIRDIDWARKQIRPYRNTRESTTQ